MDFAYLLLRFQPPVTHILRKFVPKVKYAHFGNIT